MTKEITGWKDELKGALEEMGNVPARRFYDIMENFIQSQIASAVEAERAKWVFASDGVRKTMTELFLQDKQNEQINPSKE